MFVYSKRNIILPGPNGEKFRMPKDYMGPVPAWAEDSAYLKALMTDGKVVLSESGTDKDFTAKEKKGGKKGGKKPDKSPEPPTPTGDPGEKEEAPGEDQSEAPDVPGE